MLHSSLECKQYVERSIERGIDDQRLFTASAIGSDMDRAEYLDRLDASADDVEDLFEHFEELEAAGRSYYALPDARHGVERGTVIVDGEDAIVRGYPSIPRVLVLETGVPSFFESGATVAIEEKLDGFNVRIADVGEPLAFTRSGYVCPYTTARARKLLESELSAFFDDYPDAMLCAELVGAETPYTSHDYEEVDSHAFRVFGIRDRESGVPLPVEERRERCATYGFAQPQLFDLADPSAAVESVREAIEELDAAGREGVVLRSADGLDKVKYTTRSQHHAELAYAFSLPFDRGRDFVFSRIVREAFQAAEFETDEDRLRERAQELGESILLPMVETIRDVEEGRTVGDRHTVRGSPETIDALLAHLQDQSLSLEIEADRREGDTRIVTFRKIAEATRDRTEYFLSGGTIDE